MAKVLVVEDDPILLELYSDLLRGEAIEVDIAADGEAGFFSAQKGGYDLILLDVNLPKKEGPQILEELSKTPPSQVNKKIVMLTNAVEQDIVEKVRAFGVTDLIMKSSLTPDEFLQKIKSILTA